MSTPETAMRVLDERNRLMDAVKAARLEVTDSGFDFTSDEGDFVYEVDGQRIEVIVREIAGWEGEPPPGAGCACTRRILATLEETLACSGAFRYQPGTGFVHAVWRNR